MGTWVPGLLLGLVISACGGRAQGEFDPVACTDRLDNDGDSLKDCKDPDCRGLKICEPTHEVELDTTPLPTRDATVGVSTATSDPRPPTATDDAGDFTSGMIDDEDDAGWEVPVLTQGACGEQLCTPNERCVERRCVAVTDAGTPGPKPTISVSVTQASIGRRNADNMCVDRDCDDIVLLCVCDPDPYAEIRLNGQVVKTTAVIEDSLEPIWDEPAVEIVYQPGDVLEAVLFDRDVGAVQDELLFKCTLTPPALGGVPISCAGPTKTDGRASTLGVYMRAL